MNIRRRTRWCTVFGFALFTTLTFAIGGIAQQAPTSEFQLDGTAAQNTSYPDCVYGPCDYWDLLNGSGVGSGSNGNSVARSFINGETSTMAFIGGGSKDPKDLTSWSCTSKSSPDKDTITNGYAAAYVAPNSDLVTVFGADRLSTNGDANIGIWFFQQNVQCDTSTGHFIQKNGLPATHVLHDIFAVSAFTQGGTIPTISVYEWNPACAAGVKNPVAGAGPPTSCADSNLSLLFSAASLCDNSGTLSSLPACAITNTSNIQVSWPYPTLTSTTPSTIPAQAFFTGGIDLTHFLGGAICFTSFLEETRSSQTTSAVLKDFILGAFPVCALSLSKSCTGSSPVNNNTAFQYTFSGTVTNTGAGTIDNVTIGDPLCSKGASCTGLNVGSLAAKASATYTVTFTTTPSSATNTATATGTAGGETITATCPPGTGTTCSATCTGSISSNVTIAKHCVAPGLSDLSCSSGGCVVEVPISAQVCNQTAFPCTKNGDCLALNMTCSASGFCAGAQLQNIQVADTPATLAALSPNGFTLNPGDCTGGVTTTVACGGTNPSCPTGYSCVTGTGGSFCVTPPNPTGTYIPTSFDSSSTGTSNGRFLFDDTVSVTGATPAIGPPITPVTCAATGGSVLACAGQQCPLCPLGECATSPLP